MARQKIRINLTNEEYNLLNYITRKTKTDCWFWLDKDKEGFDCVKDLESGYKITLRHGVQELNEAIIPEYLGLSIEDIEVYTNLLNKLQIKDNPFTEEITVYKNVYLGNANGICTQ